MGMSLGFMSQEIDRVFNGLCNVYGMVPINENFHSSFGVMTKNCYANNPANGGGVQVKFDLHRMGYSTASWIRPRTRNHNKPLSMADANRKISAEKLYDNMINHRDVFVRFMVGLCRSDFNLETGRDFKGARPLSAVELIGE